MRTIVLGPPGSGKTTVSIDLATLGFPVIDADVLWELGSWVDYKTGARVEYNSDGMEGAHFFWDAARLIQFLCTHENCILVGISHNSFDLAWLFDEVLLLKPDVAAVTEEKVHEFLAKRNNRYDPWSNLQQWKDDCVSYARLVESTYKCTAFVQKYDNMLLRTLRRHLGNPSRHKGVVKSANMLAESFSHMSLSSFTSANRSKIFNLQEVKRTNPMKDKWVKLLAEKGDGDYRLAWIISEMREFLDTDSKDQIQRRLEIIDFLLLPDLVYGGDFSCLDGRFIQRVFSEEEFVNLKGVLAKVANKAEILKDGYDAWDAKNVAKGRPSRPWSMIEPLLWNASRLYQEALTV